MIKTKEDLKRYLKKDKLALGKKYKHPKIFNDEIWKFEILLRKTEFYFNNRSKIIYRLLYYLNMYKFHKCRVKLGYSIPLNVFSEGLSIAHRGTIVVNGNAKIGKNCRIQECTTIGATNGNCDAPILGDNIFIGSGARIIGNIKIADDIAIGANSFVNKSFLESSITIAGIPAKKISDNSSHSNLERDLFVEGEINEK